MVQRQMIHPQVPEIPQQKDEPETQQGWGPFSSLLLTTGPEIAPNTEDILSPRQPKATMQMSGPSVARIGALHFTEQREIKEEAQDRMSQYIWEQSSIAGYSCEALGGSINDIRTADWVSEHASIDGSRQSGSIAVPSPRYKADDCGMPEGCGIEGCSALGSWTVLLEFWVSI